MPPFKDVTGHVFGRLTALSRATHRRVAWLCQCACGQQTIVTGDKLSNGHTQSCGCWRREQTSRQRSKPKPQAGEVYGRLTVIEFLDHDSRHPRVRCRCACGNITEPHWQSLKKGQTLSCGCFRREITAQVTRTHGQSSAREFWTWAGMIDRCYRAKRKDFSRYGGRGIRVCDRWRYSFANFYADMGPRPSPKHSIDRIDTNGHYEPDNVRWATAREQRMNQRRMQR